MLTKADLDGLQCSNLACSEYHGGLYLHSRCHPGVPTWAVYEAGKLRIECSECGATVTTVLVADTDELPAAAVVGKRDALIRAGYGDASAILNVLHQAGWKIEPGGPNAVYTPDSDPPGE